MPRRCRACPCCPSRPRALSRPDSSTCTSFKQSPPRNEAGGGRQSAGLRASGASRKQAPVQQLRDLCCREKISTRTPLQRLVDNPGHWPLRNISQPSRGQVRQQVCPEDRSAQTLQWSCRKHVSRPQTQDEVHKKVGGGAFATANLDVCKLLALGCVEPSGCNRSFSHLWAALKPTVTATWILSTQLPSASGKTTSNTASRKSLGTGHSPRLILLGSECSIGSRNGID